jgi:hypothetical protein
MAILLPRIFCKMCLGVSKILMVLLSEYNKMLPFKYLAGGCGNNCKTDNDVTDLPDPLSPTMATNSPLAISISIFCKVE